MRRDHLELIDLDSVGSPDWNKSTSTWKAWLRTERRDATRDTKRVSERNGKWMQLANTLEDDNLRKNLIVSSIESGQQLRCFIHHMPSRRWLAEHPYPDNTHRPIFILGRRCQHHNHSNSSHNNKFLKARLLHPLSQSITNIFLPEPSQLLQVHHNVVVAQDMSKTIQSVSTYT